MLPPYIATAALDSQIILDSADPIHPTTLPVPHPTESFWLIGDANPLAKHGSSGSLTEEADICLIGSGMTSVSAAYHLSQSELPGKLSAVILEARDFCTWCSALN